MRLQQCKKVVILNIFMHYFFSFLYDSIIISRFVFIFHFRLSIPKLPKRNSSQNLTIDLLFSCNYPQAFISIELEAFKSHLLTLWWPCLFSDMCLSDPLMGRFSDLRGVFTNVSQALQNILSKFVYCRNRTSYKNFKRKIRVCAQSHALGTHAKFQLGILTINVVSGIVYFSRVYFKELAKCSWNTPPGP